MLRVGIVQYLNAWPLAWSFLDGRSPAGVEPVLLPPSAVADELAAGRIDVGLIPSAALATIPDLAVVPGLCVASASEVKSVLLVSRVPPAEIRRLALDGSSRTSAVLVQILLADVWGARPECHVVDPDLEAMLADADAALVIGDPALGIDRSRHHVVDLARAWRDLTGLPFVFAVWAARGAVGASAELVALFHESFRAGWSDLDRIVDRAERELDFDRAEIELYLTQNLRYDLDTLERRSLREFFDRAARLGLLAPVADLRFFPDPTPTDAVAPG